MGLEKSCEFYDHSKCLLKNHYCDLHCNRLSHEEEFDLYEKKSPINEEQNEELDKEIRRTGWRLRP